jgi:hypothetical protein
MIKVFDMLKSILRCVFITICAIIRVSELSAQDSSSGLIEQLEPLKPYIGKTWKGEFVGSTAERKIFDVSKWERALNGKAIRIIHSLNEGEYGGETLILWDPEKEKLIFFYFTTAGFYTQGTIAFEEGAFISHEKLTGNEDDISAVKAISKILPDGRMHSKSQYLKNGDWVDGHEIYYAEDPSAEVVFR